MPGLTPKIDMGEAEDDSFQEQPPFPWDSLSDTIPGCKEKKIARTRRTILAFCLSGYNDTGDCSEK